VAWGRHDSAQIRVKGLLRSVIFSCKGASEAERRQNSGLDPTVHVVLIRPVREARLDTASMAWWTLQPCQSLLHKSLHPLIDMLTAHPHHGRHGSDRHLYALGASVQECRRFSPWP
jgi:hypothetical protein